MRWPSSAFESAEFSPTSLEHHILKTSNSHAVRLFKTAHLFASIGTLPPRSAKSGAVRLLHWQSKHKQNGMAAKVETIRSHPVVPSRVRIELICYTLTFRCCSEFRSSIG